MLQTETCTVANCGKPSAASLGKRSLCEEHFIAACYGRIDELKRRLSERPFRDTNAETVRHFVSECMRQAAKLADQAHGPDNLRCAALSDILVQASDLLEHLRRSPRTTDCRRIRLRSDELGHEWEEDTQTVMISRHGAAVNCEHAANTDQRLLVIIPETGRHVNARVSFCAPRDDGRVEIGIEFLDCDNFWD
jgi:hypothetical protein